MSSDYDELDEFNDRVGGSSHSSGGRRPSPGEDQAPDASEEGLKEAKDARMWAVQGPNYFPCDEAVKTLAPGQYEVQHSPNSGYFFQRKEAKFDELMRLPDSASEEIYGNLMGLYKFVYRRLLDANMERSLDAADEALEVLEHLRETWSLAVRKKALEGQPEGAPAIAPPPRLPIAG